MSTEQVIIFYARSNRRLEEQINSWLRNHSNDIFVLDMQISNSVDDIVCLLRYTDK
mgnify:CR=1 FL=1